MATRALEDEHNVQVPAKGALAGEYTLLIIDLTLSLSEANVGIATGS
jgi:hypothetical protein